jgi:formate hydrogenlyase subunit 3/multisubunit Na+/H+ antiporter MnhD subunit
VPPDNSVPNRRLLVVVCAVIAVLFFIVGVIYLIEPARSLPDALGYANTGGHRLVRAAGSVIFGIGFAAGAWGIMTYKPKAPCSTPDSTAVGS